MIAYLRGKVLSFEECTALLDVGGVGYEVLLPAIEAKALRTRLRRDGEASTQHGPNGPNEQDGPNEQEGQDGQEAALWIYYHVAERQPRPLLIGFNERQNRAFFELLLSVAEVGPTVAARSMTIAVCDYASAIERRDVRTLGTLPGIGKRKAEQIVATLKGKALHFALLPPPEIEEAAETVAEDFMADVEAVLGGLGYKRPEAARMMESARRRRPDVTNAQGLLEEIWRGEQPE